jgi:hypothetical protein
MYIPPFEITPTEVAGGCIAIYQNIWENPQETIDVIEKVTSDETSGIKFVRATTTSIENSYMRTNSHLSVSKSGETSEEFRKINNRFFDLTYAATIDYVKRFGGDFQFFFNEGFNLLKYQTGQEYKAHYDGLTASGRSISPILYLNDDYEGGEIEFVNFNLKIKPRAGMLVLFPANFAYQHIAHPVTSGTKYAIVTWLHDRPIVALPNSKKESLNTDE